MHGFTCPCLQVGREKESLIPDDLRLYGPAKFLEQDPPSPEVMRIAQLHIPDKLKNLKLSKGEKRNGVTFKAKVSNAHMHEHHSLYPRMPSRPPLPFSPTHKHRFSMRCCAP